MASTLAFVSAPGVDRTLFDSLLLQARTAGLLAPGAEFTWYRSAGKLVARGPGAEADTAVLRARVYEFMDTQNQPLVCAAAIDSQLLEARQLLLVMDVDSTLIKQEVIELLAAHAGREAEVAAVTEAAMRGELDFAQSLIQRVATLKGLDVSVLAETRQRIVLSDGARQLVERFHAAGHKVGVVSGGFQQILDPLADELGLDHALANTLGIAGGVLDGAVHGRIVDRAVKEQMLRQWAQEHGIGLHATIAAGDGANDLDMVGAAGLGVAFNAKPALRQAADVRLDFAQLDVIADLVLADAEPLA